MSIHNINPNFLLISLFIMGTVTLTNFPQIPRVWWTNLKSWLSGNLTAIVASLNTAIQASEKGAASGVASLTSQGILTQTQFGIDLLGLKRIIEWKSKTQITVYGGTIFKIGTASPVYFYLATDTDYAIADILDTGSISNGKDYYVYACNNAGALTFKVSLASTYPSGFTAETSRKIGGFHTLCVSVGTIGGHTLTGYVANDILPASVWDLKHRPVSEPAGMVYVNAIDKWVDIYLPSGTGASTLSVNGGTISDTRNWMDFVDDGAAVKKRLMRDAEFQIAAGGSNEGTNITGSADPVTTGGHNDTAGRRMISNYGNEDMCGAIWQWLLDQSYRFDLGALAITTASATLTITHAASPGGNTIYVKFDDGGRPYLCCNMANDAVDKWLTFGSAYTILVKHDASAAVGGVAVYFDEDATQPSRFLSALTGLKDVYIPTSNPQGFFKITYNATPATPGVVVNYDDDTDERLEFISPTSTNGTADLALVTLTDPAFSYKDQTGGKGKLYTQGTYGDVKLRGGGYWDGSTNCGSRGRTVYSYRWEASTNVGGRFLSERKK